MRADVSRTSSVAKCRRLFAPLLHIDLVELSPWLASEGAIALMRHGNRPCSQPQPLLARSSAEVDIVEMEVESRIELHGFRQQGVPVRCQENAVQQLAVGRHRTHAVDVAERLQPMGNDSREIRQIVPGQVDVDVVPAHMVLRQASIARQADDVVGAQPVRDAIGQEEVVQPDIVVNEDEHVIGIGRRERAVEDIGQTPPILEAHARSQAAIETEPTQRLPERGIGPKLGLRQSGRTDDIDHCSVGRATAP